MLPIRSPTVPAGTERLRIILHYHNTREEAEQTHTHTYTYTYTHTHRCLEKALFRRRVMFGKSAVRAPNQGLDSSFCRWIVGQRLAEKEWFFTDTGITDGIVTPDPNPRNLANWCS